MVPTAEAMSKYRALCAGSMLAEQIIQEIDEKSGFSEEQKDTMLAEFMVSLMRWDDSRAEGRAQ